MSGPFPPEVADQFGRNLVSCRELLTRIGELTGAIDELRSDQRSPPRRFATDARLARHAGCAPIEVSSRRYRRHRLSRMGNRKTRRFTRVVWRVVQQPQAVPLTALPARG